MLCWEFIRRFSHVRLSADTKCLAVNVWDVLSYRLATCQQPQCKVFLLQWSTEVDRPTVCT